jgi:hypothetical protein
MQRHMDWTTSEGRRFVFGIVLVLGGLVLLANRLDIFHFFALWPLFIVGLGLAKIVGACCGRQRRNGIWLVAFGVWFSINEFTSLGYHHTWPLILVAVGGMLAWDAMAAPTSCPRSAEDRHGR